MICLTPRIWIDPKEVCAVENHNMTIGWKSSNGDSESREEIRTAVVLRSGKTFYLEEDISVVIDKLCSTGER